MSFKAGIKALVLISNYDYNDLEDSAYHFGKGNSTISWFDNDNDSIDLVINSPLETDDGIDVNVDGLRALTYFQGKEQIEFLKFMCEQALREIQSYEASSK